MTLRRLNSTRDKALEINLDDTYHGTFAEIGAGQEVARWFFRVGGAAGTIAKTISAYDMKFSDAIYGHAHKYVSRERLNAMLDHEYGLLLERLDATRGEKTRFFAFANTVAARSYTRHDNSHGWLGVRFQHRPRAEPSQIVLHANLLDTENSVQQEALGVLGVNLVYGAFFESEEPRELIQSLLAELSTERVEIDMLELAGPAFAGVDNRLMSLYLVELGLTNAAMFEADGMVTDPADALYKRSVLVERGDFRPVTRLHEAILERALARFRSDLDATNDAPLVLRELTLHDLGREERHDHVDFVARVDMLSALGGTVLVTRFGQYYALADYLGRYTTQPIGLAAGVPALARIFDEQYYGELRGGILEAISRLFAKNVRLYAYPERVRDSDRHVSCDDLSLPPRLRPLYGYLRDNGFIVPLEARPEDAPDVEPAAVRERLLAGDPSWESFVPEPIAAVIKQRKLFGYRERREDCRLPR